MLRRFECYGFAPETPVAARAELARVLRDTGRFIPEVLDSATGTDRSETPIDLVWEHTYAHASAYATYMCHPFHVCVLDRYLLPESPECVTEPRRGLALGLLGYETDDVTRVTDGVRRIVALRADPAAPRAQVDAFVAGLASEPPPGAVGSAAGPNSMGLEWYPDGWTHVWEQTFPDEASMVAALAAEAALLDAGPVLDRVALWYPIEAGPSPTSSPGSAPRTAVPDESAGPLTLVDVVWMAEESVDAYLDDFARLYLPGAERRGLELTACWRTPGGIGEDVTVTTALAVGSWAAWEQVRNAAVRDPDVGEWVRRRRTLIRGGRRTFVTSPVR